MAGKKSTSIEKETVEVITEVKETKQVKTRKQIDKGEMVCCRSVYNGVLNYKSPKSGMSVKWTEYGSEEWLPVEELLTMKSSKPVFLTKPWIVIEDNEDVIEYLGLRKLYEDIINVDELDSFFLLPIEEIKEKLTKLPKGYKDTIGEKARELVENEELYDIRIIKLLEEELKIDLTILSK